MSKMPISYLNSLEGLNKRVEKLEEGGSGGIQFPQTTSYPRYTLGRNIELVVDSNPESMKFDILAIIPYYSPVQPKSITIKAKSTYRAYLPNENPEECTLYLNYTFTDDDTTINIKYSTPNQIYAYIPTQGIAGPGHTASAEDFDAKHFYLIPWGTFAMDINY